MACFEHGTIIGMKPRETVTLPDLRGTTLRVTRGTLWITQEGDPQDIVLRDGDTWTIERDGLTIVEAQSDSSFCVVGRRVETLIRNRANARGSSAWDRARDAAAAFFLTPSRSPAPYV
ncbi:MAG TPA: DUF2917 domain-containing protein [Casimicrobiaceae bacterium]|nr:DUF2917 domain-containing protein [Casimicrobiaceae bacterium]